MTLDPRLATVLRDGVLDRETKLKVIDLLSYADENVGSQVSKLVIEWNETDRGANDVLWKALEAISKSRV